MRVMKLCSCRCAESPQPGSAMLRLVGGLQVVTCGLARLEPSPLLPLLLSFPGMSDQSSAAGSCRLSAQNLRVRPSSVTAQHPGHWLASGLQGTTADTRRNWSRDECSGPDSCCMGSMVGAEAPRSPQSCLRCWKQAALSAAALSKGVGMIPVGANQTGAARGFTGRAPLGVGCSSWHSEDHAPGAGPSSAHTPSAKCFLIIRGTERHLSQRRESCISSLRLECSPEQWEVMRAHGLLCKACISSSGSSSVILWQYEYVLCGAGACGWVLFCLGVRGAAAWSQSLQNSSGRFGIPHLSVRFSSAREQRCCWELLLQSPPRATLWSALLCDHLTRDTHGETLLLLTYILVYHEVGLISC